MSFLFREIRNKSWWDKSQDELPWLQENELVADVFKGLGTKDGTLSTYVIDDTMSNLMQVVAAFASTRNSFDRVDYVLVPLGEVASVFELHETPGETADDQVNEWHVDIVHLTPSALVNLAYLIRDYRHTMQRVLEKQVEVEVRSAVAAGFLDCDKIKSQLKSKICT